VIDPDVRSALIDDVEQLRWLESEARQQLVGARGGERWLATHAVRDDAWADVLVADRVFVATIDEVVVGYLVMSMSVDIAQVDEVYVTPGAREVGFGDALLAAAVAHARALGALVLEGEALPGDRDTKNLYERAGITARLITVSARLEP
jgi:GNAT superfamily N-acetyltransferase